MNHVVRPAPTEIDRLAAVGASTWPGEGDRWIREPRRSAPVLDGLLRWAWELGASRISFESGHPVMLRVHGRNRPATQDAIEHPALVEIVGHLYGGDGAGRLLGGNDFDLSYSVSVSRMQQLRFRVNATPITTKRGDGVHIVLRPIPDMPPSLEEQLVEPAIRAAMRHKGGMKLVAGATGSGKSTLLASSLLDMVMDPALHINIATGEAPIEFLLEHVAGPSGSKIKQTEIPRQLKSFGAFIRGCMRREFTHIEVGECRDGETMAASLHAALTGHDLYTTLHTENVALTIQRAVALCPVEERDNLTSALGQVLRLIVNQRLVPTVDGRRTAIREFVVFDRALRMRLLRAPAVDWPAIVEEAVREHGQTFEAAIRRALAEGRISEETADDELRRDA